MLSLYPQPQYAPCRWRAGGPMVLVHTCAVLLDEGNFVSWRDGSSVLSLIYTHTHTGHRIKHTKYLCMSSSGVLEKFLIFFCDFREWTSVIHSWMRTNVVSSKKQPVWEKRGRVALTLIRETPQLSVIFTIVKVQVEFTKKNMTKSQGCR